MFAASEERIWVEISGQLDVESRVQMGAILTKSLPAKNNGYCHLGPFSYVAVPFCSLWSSFLLVGLYGYVTYIYDLGK